MEIGWPGARKLTSVFPTPHGASTDSSFPSLGLCFPNDRPLRTLQSDFFGLCDPSKDTGGSWELGLGVADDQYSMSARATLMVISYSMGLCVVSLSELRDKRDHPEVLLEGQAGSVRPHLLRALIPMVDRPGRD